MFKNKMSPSLKTAFLQLSLVAIYFPLYYLSIWSGLIFAGFFLLLDLTAWPNALKLHSKQGAFKYLVITVGTSFIAVILFFANVYEIIGTIAISGTTNYITGLWEHVYFSVVTFTTLGYGEYTPQGYAKIATSIQAILGLGYFAFIVGVSSAIFYSKIQKT